MLSIFKKRVSAEEMAFTLMQLTGGPEVRQKDGESLEQANNTLGLALTQVSQFEVIAAEMLFLRGFATQLACAIEFGDSLASRDTAVCYDNNWRLWSAEDGYYWIQQTGFVPKMHIEEATTDPSQVFAAAYFERREIYQRATANRNPTDSVQAVGSEFSRLCEGELRLELMMFGSTHFGGAVSVIRDLCGKLKLR